MNSGDNLVGSHRALSEVIQIDEFQNWITQTERGEFEEFFGGYRLLVHSVYQVFQDRVNQYRDVLSINSNREYERAHAQIADIDSLRADCDASNLIKNLDKIDEKIHTTHDFSTLSESLSTLQSEVTKPFNNLLCRVTSNSSSVTNEDCSHYLALFSLVTFSNDTTRGYPEAFQVGWIENRFSRDDLNNWFEGYKTALYWAYTKISCFEERESSLAESILGADNWDELNVSVQQARTELLAPFEEKFEGNPSTLYHTRNVDSCNEISHLLIDAPDTAVGIDKSLDRLFLWDSANKAGDVIYGSGSAGFLTILMGIQNVRDHLDTKEPIQVRRLVHPDNPGNNYSYAIGLSGWSLSGTGSLHGWAVFVRIATDYSGFGSSQHDLIEKYVGGLSSDEIIEIQEIDVQEELLEEYLSKQGTRTSYQGAQQQEPRYDKRRLTDILRGNEDIRTEFKQQIDSPDKITAEIAALANQEGGVLLIGVSDEGEVIGLDNADKTDNLLSSILNDKLTPPLSADIHRETIRGKSIVIVEVPDADRPVAFDYVYYGRKGSNKRKLTYFELKKRYG